MEKVAAVAESRQVEERGKIEPTSCDPEAVRHVIHRGEVPTSPGKLVLRRRRELSRR